MMKHTFFLTLLLAWFVTLSVKAQNVTFGGITYDIDTAAFYPVGPGTDYLKLRLTRTNTTQNALDVYVMRVDTRNPYVGLEQQLGQNKLVGTERPSAMAERITTPTHVAFAGTNGDFFVTQGDVGRPIGLTIENDEYAYIGSSDRRVGGVTADGKPVVATNWKYTGRLYTATKDTLVIKHVNYNREADELVLYNQHQGLNTGTNSYGTEVLVALCEGETWKTHGRQLVKVISKERNQGSMIIPAGQAVLSGHGAMQQALDELVNVGDTLTVRFTLKLDDVTTALSQAIGGDNYALILDNGVAETVNFWNEIHPRTGYGVSQTGDTAVFCVVDGRTSRSYGCNTSVLGEIMAYYGAWRAVNWDGGGSSSMYIRGFGGQVNHSSDGSERAVGNAMMVVANLPEADEEIARLHPYYTIYTLPYCGLYTPQFLGYNKYGVLVDTDVQGVTLECDPSVGEIQDNGTSFFASTANGGTLIATYGQARTEIEIRIVPGNMRFKYDSIVIDNRKDWQVEVVNMNDDGEQVVLATALSWKSLNDDICTVDQEGVLHAIANGKAEIVGWLGSEFADTLSVSVEIPQTPTIPAEDFVSLDGWTITSMTGFNPVPELTDGMLNVKFNFSVTRKPYVLLEKQIRLYGLPDTIKICYDTDAEFDNIQLTVSSVAGVSIFKTFADVISADGAEIVVPTEDLFADKDSKEHYPLSVRQIRFYLASTTAVGERYIRIRSITLCYEGMEITALGQIEHSTLRVYPQPASDYICVEGVAQGSVAELYNLEGYCLLSKPLSADAKLNLGQLGAGVYMLKVNDQIVKILKK